MAVRRRTTARATATRRPGGRSPRGTPSRRRASPAGSPSAPSAPVTSTSRSAAAVQVRRRTARRRRPGARRRARRSSWIRPTSRPQRGAAVHQHLATEQVQRLDAVGALVDRVEPVVAVVLLDVVVAGVAGAAEHLDGQVVGGQAPLRRPALGDRGEQPEQLLRLGAPGRVGRGRDVVDQPRAVEHRAPARPRRTTSGPAASGGRPGARRAAPAAPSAAHADRAALQPLARVGQRLEVAGVAEGGGAQADADAGLVHHREHQRQAAVLGCRRGSRRRRARPPGVNAPSPKTGAVLTVPR